MENAEQEHTGKQTKNLMAMKIILAWTKHLIW
jgi:hypothetical protein